MWRWIGFGLVIAVVALFGFSLIDSNNGEITANAIVSVPQTDISGFARAIEPYDWQFPQDHGPHPNYQTEWWYYTGNVGTEDNRRFGYQFTIFRRAITPQDATSDSEWRSNQIYMVHFTVSDIEAGNFYHNERYSRAGADLAGATTEPRYEVWLEDWQIKALNDDATELQINAAADQVAINLTLNQVKPPALQGDHGLSSKSGVEGNASYYYSLSRLVTEGTLTIEDQTYAVNGNTWMDHEFSTSALGSNALGWDWFGLIFDNDHELMVGQIRLVNGGTEPAFGGLMVYPDGSTQYLTHEDFSITALDTWQSPHTGATYPSGWTITVNKDVIEQDQDFSITLIPLMKDQELNSGEIAYWEGAVRIEGDTTGYGYAELTGYANAITGRF